MEGETRSPSPLRLGLLKYLAIANGLEKISELHARMIRKNMKDYSFYTPVDIMNSIVDSSKKHIEFEGILYGREKDLVNMASVFANRKKGGRGLSKECLRFQKAGIYITTYAPLILNENNDHCTHLRNRELYLRKASLNFQDEFLRTRLTENSRLFNQEKN
jgi:hypothetical protein